jgi:glycosyltransferase involved in cell wall biosynthesis
MKLLTRKQDFMISTLLYWKSAGLLGPLFVAIHVWREPCLAQGRAKSGAGRCDPVSLAKSERQFAGFDATLAAPRESMQDGNVTSRSGGSTPILDTDQDAGPKADRPVAASRTATILLCTFNGEHFLPEQLASVDRQTFTRWRLIVSDDGSSDRTRTILEIFRNAHEPGQVEIIDGPRRGASANFLFLACREGLSSDYYAFCDQDDIWEADKLARAIAILEEIGTGVPALYGSRTSLIDKDGRKFGLSPLFPKEPTFRSALVQSIAGGNTMVFNRKAHALLASCGPDVVIPSHDWWLYQMTSACGGKVHYDFYPSVRYRQHARNVIGSNMGFSARLRRLWMLGKGRFRYWSDLNVEALARLRPRMSAENRQIFDLFCKARHRPLLQRARMFVEAGVYRQTLLGNLGLVAAVILKKI